MLAALLQSIAPVDSSPLKLNEVSDPSPAPREVRVRVGCCAVCRTDLHVIEGDLERAPKLPLIPGHQIVGTIDQLGPGCARLRIGQRIGIAWLRHTDGTCRFCIAGRENLCPNSLYTGYQADGGYAQYATVPEDFAYELPDAFDDISAAPLLCAGIIGYRALKRANLPPKGKLAIFGFGSSAHIITQLVLHEDHEVYVVSRSANHQRLARELGASWAGADAAAMPHKVHSAILFAPAGRLVPLALDCLDSGGTLSLAGIHMSPIPQMDYDRFLFRERDIHPVTSNTREDGRELLARAAAARIKPHTAVYPLREANRALQDLKADRINGTGVLVP